MTRNQLEAEANGVLAAMKATVELQDDFPFTILIHLSNGWNRLPFPEELSALLNDGKAKDAIFDAVRKTIQAHAADAVIFASDTWCSIATPEGMKHYGTPEWKELHDHGFVRLVQRGWVERCEAFTVTAQDPTGALLIQQKYQRLESGRIQLLDSKREWFDQRKFSGRQKMFGDLRWENPGSEAAVKGNPES